VIGLALDRKFLR